MTIKNSFPASLRQPGILHEFDFISGASGLVPLDRVVVLVGTMGAGTATAGEPVPIFTEADADEAFEAGSELALGCRSFFKQAKLTRLMPFLYAIGYDAPGGGTAQAYTLTLGGVADESGDLVVAIAGRTIRAAVAVSDTLTTVGDSLAAAINAQKADLPVTAVNVAGVVTITANWAGATSADITARTVEAPGSITCAVASSAAGAGAVDITTTLDALLDRRYHGIAIAQHTATELSDLNDHLVEAWGKKLWGFGYAAHTGTLGNGTTLTTGVDDEKIVVLGCEDAPAMPFEIAAAAACLVEGPDKPNYNFDNAELWCPPPPLSSSVWTDGLGGEIESALAGGLTPLKPTKNGQRLKVVRMVTTKTTEGGVTFDDLRDLAIPHTSVAVAAQADAIIGARFQGANAEDEVLDDLLSELYSILKDAEAAKWIKNVDAHFEELMGEFDATVPTRAVLTAIESIVENLHQVVIVHRTKVEA